MSDWQPVDSAELSSAQPGSAQPVVERSAMPFANSKVIEEVFTTAHAHVDAMAAVRHDG